MFLMPGNPAAISTLGESRPEVLRLTLSDDLPFSNDM